jgi:hypothetical protein
MIFYLDARFKYIHRIIIKFEEIKQIVKRACALNDFYLKVSFQEMNLL